MRKSLGIEKALQHIQGKLLNKTSKFTKISKHIEKDKSWKKQKKDPTYTDEQRQLYRDRLGDLNTEKRARLEIMPEIFRHKLQRSSKPLKKFLI